MSVSPASAEDTAHVLDPRRFTVDEYHRMIAAGILDEDEHVELLEGVITSMSPQGVPHSRCIRRLNRVLARTLGDEFELFVQLPLTIGDRNEPEPDLAVVRSKDVPTDRHPSTAVLVIEIAGESLRRDRKVNVRVYSQAGIAEYWIVNVETQVVEVFNDPDPAQGTYRRVRTISKTEPLTSEALPQLSFPLADLFA
jgi:Uma2 family endonuclease